jgi:hypothetical protein
MLSQDNNKSKSLFATFALLVFLFYFMIKMHKLLICQTIDKILVQVTLVSVEYCRLTTHVITILACEK